MIRDRITEQELDRATNEIGNNVGRRLDEKGWGAFTGPHETFGVIAEEFNKELLDALQSNSVVDFRKELIDIAVACIIGMASELPEDTSAVTEEGMSGNVCNLQ